MDPSVRPGDDFFAYAEGNWLKAAVIAPDKSGAGYNYDLPDQAERDVRAIAEDAQRDPSTPQAVQELGWAGADRSRCKANSPLNSA
jgi:endothelin-converting enzyme/putative endopeptidase